MYERLRSAVLTGQYEPGERLTETRLAAAFGVSRTPIREAMQALEKDGVLVRDGRGLHVRRVTIEEVLDLYECRIEFESLAAEWAASNRTAADLVLLNHAHEEMAASQGADSLIQSERNLQFHERMWKCAHNATLLDTLTRIESQIRQFPQRTFSRPGHFEQSVAEHADILHAVEAGDTQLARDLSRNHLVRVRGERIRLLQATASTSA